MDGVAGLAGWRWIFILEGIATVLIAVGAYFLLYDYPATATFLSDEEREWVIWRLKAQWSGSTENEEKFHWKYVKAALADWQILFALICE